MTDASKSFPAYRGTLEYHCLSCSKRYPIDNLLYTCPDCGGVFLLEDATFSDLAQKDPAHWRNVFDTRASSRQDALRGIFRFYELLAPVLEEEDIVCLGEGQTPIIQGSKALVDLIGLPFSFKNDGQNPSASFKDRGMACAFSFLKYLVRTKGFDEILAVCASTGDTSASAAMYAAYVGEPIKSVVILPQGKVTPEQLSQPLGSGAVVLEMPGVFDDCMKVVEFLAENYRVALLNSKNSWRILGQESYACEVAQWFNWDLENHCIFVPIGNAGNITAIMAGFLKLRRLGIIKSLPRIFGVQSDHADPVYRYYAQDKANRHWQPVTVRPSVAQAAMIGNPVSFPRVAKLADTYIAHGRADSFQVIQVNEQQIMDATILANRHGHISCTQGGECLAGLVAAKELGLISKNEHATLDSTAHSLKFSMFQKMYFENSFPKEYEVSAKTGLGNMPRLIADQDTKNKLSPEEYTRSVAEAVAQRLSLKRG